jgi:hypothetical protein
MGRALHEAKLRLAQACVENVDYPARRELDKAVGIAEALDRKDGDAPGAMR